MPPLKDVTTMITAARSRQIRFTMIIQNFAQLDSVYGKEDAETLRGNCGNLIYLVTTELKALEEISKMCGEVKSKKDDKTASTPLVTVADLQRMKENEVILKRLRMNPFKTTFTPDWKINWGKKYPSAKYPTRKRNAVKTFDIKEFVKSEKKKKLLEMMNAADNDNNSNSNEGMFPSSMPGSIPGGMFSNTMMHNMPLFPRRDEIQNRNITTDSMVKPDNKQKSVTPDFDVDELVKKIDAKIAELEEEERKNQEEEKKKKENSKVEVIGDKESEIIHKDKVIESNLDLEDDLDDDDFFDDFFDN